MHSIPVQISRTLSFSSRKACIRDNTNFCQANCSSCLKLFMVAVLYTKAANKKVLLVSCLLSKSHQRERYHTTGSRERVLLEGLLQAGSKVEGGLAAKLDDDTLWPLLGDNLEHILNREGLEVQPAAGVVVSGHCLGVAVQHDGLIPSLPVPMQKASKHNPEVPQHHVLQAMSFSATEDRMPLQISKIHWNRPACRSVSPACDQHESRALHMVGSMS